MKLLFVLMYKQVTKTIWIRSESSNSWKKLFMSWMT
jgi:hypothetical protein